jgi:hypothetical protein
LRHAGATSASQEATARLSSEFLDRLATDVRTALRGESDIIVQAMRPAFAKALAVVDTAAFVGIASTTNADEMVQAGDAKAMAAFRQLPAAVRTLDEVAHLRDQLTQVCDVGPYEYPAAAWLAEADTLLDLVGAANHNDSTRTVPYSNPMGAGFLQATVHRTGGRWLALLTAGYKLRLNTGAEAHALVDKVRNE